MHSRRDWHTQILSDCNQWYQHTVVVIQCTHQDTTICTAIPCINPSEHIGTNILNHCMCCLCKQVLCTGLLKCSQFIPAEGPDCMTYMPAWCSQFQWLQCQSLFDSAVWMIKEHTKHIGKNEAKQINSEIQSIKFTSNWPQGSSDCSESVNAIILSTGTRHSAT